MLRGMRLSRERLMGFLADAQRGHLRGSRALAVVGHGESSKVEALLATAKRSSHAFPPWLQAELRTNHAGEFGAVEIYRGALFGACPVHHRSCV